MFVKLYTAAIIYSLYAVLNHIFVFSSESRNNYGEFSLNLNRFELCKGPKRMECCHISARVGNKTDVYYNITIMKDVIPTRGKVVATINGQPFLRLQMKKPCDHLFMKPLFQAMLNVTDDCVFVHGDYRLKVDIETVAQKYYGGMFIYGNITFKSMFYNDECNFSCTVVHVELYPKKNKTITKN